MSEQNSVTFREVQRMRRAWWVMLLIAGIAAMIWYTFVQQILLDHLAGTNPGSDWSVWVIWLVFGIGFPAGFVIMRLVVEVREDHITIRYVPFLRQRIPFADIEGHTARTYSPIGEYGGWGIKGWHRGRVSYSISGNRGVELELKTGEGVASQHVVMTEDVVAAEASIVTEDAAAYVAGVATEEGAVVAGVVAVADESEPEKLEGPEAEEK